MSALSATVLPPSIILTDSEAYLFSFLSKVAESASERVVLRVAGGWVRDKVLGLDSDDIDIALGEGYYYCCLLLLLVPSFISHSHHSFASLIRITFIHLQTPSLASHSQNSAAHT